MLKHYDQHRKNLNILLLLKKIEVKIEYRKLILHFVKTKTLFNKRHS